MSETATIRSLAAPSGFFDGDWVESKDQDPEGSIRLLQLADIGDGVFRDRSDRWLNRQAFARLDCKPVLAGDILIGRMPDPIGRCCLVPRGIGDAITVVDVAVLRVDHARVDARFAMYAINSFGVRSLIIAAQDGATRQRIPRRQLGRTLVPTPPLGKQRLIADYLDRETRRIDELIAEQRGLIETLRERRVAIIRSLTWPQPDWLRVKIKHFADTALGKMLDAGKVARDGELLSPYVRAADILATGEINLDDLNRMPFSQGEIRHLDLRRGDVLLIEGGATVGRPGFIREDVSGVSFQKTVNRLRVRGQAESRFVYWSLVSLYEANYFIETYNAVSFVHLTGEKLREISIALPTVDEQRSIAATIDEQTSRIDALIAESEDLIVLSRERRAALITAAVTGQIGVRTAA